MYEEVQGEKEKNDENVHPVIRVGKQYKKWQPTNKIPPSHKENEQQAWEEGVCKDNSFAVLKDKVRDEEIRTNITISADQNTDDKQHTISTKEWIERAFVQKENIPNYIKKGKDNHQGTNNNVKEGVISVPTRSEENQSDNSIGTRMQQVMNTDQRNCDSNNEPIPEVAAEGNNGNVEGLLGDMAEAQQGHMCRGKVDKMGDTCRKEPHEYDDEELKNQVEMKDTFTTHGREENEDSQSLVIIPAAAQKSEMELILMSELASAEYHEPLQIAGVSDGEVTKNIQDHQEPLELENNKVESTLASAIAGKSAPMDRLHELISHKCLNKDPSFEGPFLLM